MPGPVLSSTMTLDGSQYLATNAKVLQATQLVEAAMARMHERIRQLTIGLQPAQSSISTTALALGGLANDTVTRGVAQLSAALGAVAQRAGDATDALSGARANAEGLGNAVDQNEDVHKSEAETPAAEGSGGKESDSLGRFVSTAAGAAAGTHQLAEEDKKLDTEMRHLDDTIKKTTHETEQHGKESEKDAEHTKHLQKEVNELRGGFHGLGETVSKTAEIMRDAFMAVPELAAIVAVFSGVAETVQKVRESFQYGDQLNALSRQTGESAQTIAALRRTFDYFDVSADEVGHTLFMLQRALGGVSEGGEPTAEAFGRIGLSIQQLKGMNAADQFAAIQAGLAKLPTQADRANVAMKIFGRSALEVQSILNASPADFAESMHAAQEYAQVMGRSADMFEEIERKFYIFKEQVDTIFARIAVALAPAIGNVLDLVNKVDFSKWGKGIQEVIGIMVQAFSQGQVFRLLELGLAVSFKNAVNTFYGLFAGAIAGVTAGFSHLPKILSDGLGFLGNRNYWEGTAEIFAGAFLIQLESVSAAISRTFSSISGLLITAFTKGWSVGKALFEDMAWAMKNPISSILGLLSSGLQKLTGAMGAIGSGIGTKLGEAWTGVKSDFDSAGTATGDVVKSAQNYIDQMTQNLIAAGISAAPKVIGAVTDPQSLVQGGLTKVSQATAGLGDLPKDFADTIKDEFTKALAAFKGGKILDASQDLADIQRIIAKLKAAIPSGSDSHSPSGAGPTEPMAGYNYKQPEGDRLQKLGLFLGTHAASPGLSELRRIANATEATARNLLKNTASPGATLRSAIPSYG